MTEAEAKTRWCPMARLVIMEKLERSPPHNRILFMGKDGAREDFSRCIGSACMMWRRMVEGTAEPSDSGFCGLAGEP